MSRKHYTITPDANGQPIKTRIWDWFRQNANQFPNLRPDEIRTSTIRRALRKLDWMEESNGDEAYMIMPDSSNSTDYANTLLDSIADTSEDEENIEDLEELSFGLEKDLQAAIRKNITSLKTGLRIIDGGTEKNTIAGRIDVTAEDANGNTVVIELKAGKAKPDVIAQILSYMTALKDEGHKNVKGIIIASDFHDRVKLAAKALDFIELIEYSFQFAFKPV